MARSRSPAADHPPASARARARSPRYAQARQRHLEQVELAKKRKLWVELEHVRVKAVEAKAQQKLEEQNLAAEQASMEPVRQAIEDAKTSEKKMARRYTATANEVKKAMDELGREKDNATKFEEVEEELVHELENLEKAQQQRKTKLDKAQRDLEQKENELAECDVEEAQRTFDELKPLFKEVTAALSKTEDELQDAQSQQKVQKEKHGDALKRLNQLDSVDERRKQQYKKVAREMGDQSLTLRDYIDTNRAKFRREVYGPIALEVTVDAPHHQLVFENQVPWHWLNGFVTQHDDDYKLLMSLPEKIRGKIAVTNIPDKVVPNRRISEAAYNDLRQQFGVEGTLDQFVKCNDAVMSALLDNAHIADALICSDPRMDKGLNQFQDRLLRDKQRSYMLYYARPAGAAASRGGRGAAAGGPSWVKSAAQVSRHGTAQQFSSSEVGVEPKHMLSAALDPQERESAQTVVKSAAEEFNSLKNEVGRLQELQRAQAYEKETLRVRGNEAQKVKNAQKKLTTEIANLKTKVDSLTAQMGANDDREKAQLYKKQETTLKRHVNSIASAQVKGRLLMETSAKSAGAKLNEELAKATHSRARRELEHRQERLAELEELADAAKQRFQVLKQELLELKQRNDREAPATEELQRELQKLPESLDELNALIEVEQQQADAIHDNPAVILAYNKRKQEIEELESQIKDMQAHFAEKQARFDKLREPWESTLNEAIEGMREKFGLFMQDLSAGGGLDLKKANSLDQWGLEIMVRFRETARLEKLQASVQSGGERSVSTIMYLMAMQDMMPSPFRMVDEINQGMDERNERLVFKRIVECTTGPDMPQYWLITPKLLEGLTAMDNPDVTALVVMNGPWNLKRPQDWDLDSFVSKKKRLAAQATA